MTLARITATASGTAPTRDVVGPYGRPSPVGKIAGSLLRHGALLFATFFMLYPLLWIRA